MDREESEVLRQLFYLLDCDFYFFCQIYFFKFIRVADVRETGPEFVVFQRQMVRLPAKAHRTGRGRFSQFRAKNAQSFIDRQKANMSEAERDAQAEGSAPHSRFCFSSSLK